MNRYPDRPGYKQAGTSQAAADAERGRAPTLRSAVLALLAERELTADECAVEMRESVLSVRPRLSELVKMGKIEPTEERRKNASGHGAAVWRLRSKSRQQEMAL